MQQPPHPAAQVANPPLDYGHVESEPAREARIVGRVMWRLIPFMILLYIMNYLDRVNIGFAKLKMNQDLGFSDAVYALGTSIFFVGYFLFEVPSNLIMERVGARRWLARIMISWGLVSTAMMFVQGVKSFYFLRLALGIAEAGFFPGMILYLSYWIPANQRARAIAWFMTSTALSGVIGGPLAGLLLDVQGLGLKGWQWLFLIEGVPTILLGFVLLRFLTDRPEDAHWLPPADRDWLANRMRIERAATPADPHRLGDAFGDARVWMLAGTYASIMFGFYGINYWTASVIRAFASTDSRAATLSAIVFLTAAIGMVIVGRFSDHSGERLRVMAACACVGAIGMLGAAYAGSLLTVILALSLAALGIWGTLGPFWAQPAQFLRGTAAAGGIALINSIGNLGGGFIGPNIMGHLKESTKTYRAGLLVNAGVLTGAVVLGLVMRRVAARSAEMAVRRAAAFPVIATDAGAE